MDGDAELREALAWVEERLLTIHGEVEDPLEAVHRDREETLLRIALLGSGFYLDREEFGEVCLELGAKVAAGMAAALAMQLEAGLLEVREIDTQEVMREVGAGAAHLAIVVGLRVADRRASRGPGPSDE